MEDTYVGVAKNEFARHKRNSGNMSLPCQRMKMD